MKIMRRIIKAVVLLICDPKQFFKRVTARLLPLPKSPVQKKINGVLFDFDFNIDPGIKSMYYGIYEVETVRAMRKFLSKGDTFIDVGANIGYISAVALGLVGKTGQVHSFEPVPFYCDKLKNIALSNNEYKIIANRYALSDREGTANINIPNISSIGWNTIIPGFMPKETIRETIEVTTSRLDDYIKEKALNNISLIKIDTEGFEFPVLKGLSGYFESAGFPRPVIICEIAPTAYPLLGYTLAQLSEYMKKYNYRIFDMVGKNNAQLPEYMRKNDYRIFDKNIEIDITKLKETSDVLFIADNKK